MDEAKLMSLKNKLVTDMGGTAMMASVIAGDELRLYRNPRLIRERLNAQAAAGFDPRRRRRLRGRIDESAPRGDCRGRVGGPKGDMSLDEKSAVTPVSDPHPGI